MNAQECLAYIRKVYEGNNFRKLCCIDIEEVGCGWARLSMVIDKDKHTNLYGAVHGGALETLADTSLGVVGATVGARVATLNFAMSFIKNIHAGQKATVIAKVRHHGRTTMVIDVDMYNEEQVLMCQTMATMFIIGTFDEIPKKW